MSIFKLDVIAETLNQLTRDVRDLKRRSNNEEHLQEAEAGELEPSVGFLSEGAFSEYMYHVAKVQSVFEDDRLFTAQRMTTITSGNTTDSTSKWVVDDTLTSVITVDVPENVPMPDEGDIVTASFTGLYGNGTKVRYGMFSPGNGTMTAKFLEEFDNTLTCNLYKPDGTVGNTITVAKPGHLQRQAYEGKTISGISYSYLSKNTRSADDGTDTNTEYITPVYDSNYDLVVGRPANGTRVSGAAWIDMTQRQWATEV